MDRRKQELGSEVYICFISNGKADISEFNSVAKKKTRKLKIMKNTLRAILQKDRSVPKCKDTARKCGYCKLAKIFHPNIFFPSYYLSQLVLKIF